MGPCIYKTLLVTEHTSVFCASITILSKAWYVCYLMFIVFVVANSSLLSVMWRSFGLLSPSFCVTACIRVLKYLMSRFHSHVAFELWGIQTFAVSCTCICYQRNSNLAFFFSFQCFVPAALVMVSDVADHAKDSLKNGVSCILCLCETESMCAVLKWENVKMEESMEQS